MITRGFFCLFKQVPYFCATSTTGVVQLSAVGTSFILHSHNKQNQQGEKSSFSWGLFLPVLVYDRCIASAFEARACDVERSRCVCFISREHSLA